MTYTEQQALTVAGVLAEIAAERARQDAKWGQQNHPDGTGTDPEGDAEIVGWAKEACQDAAARGTCTYRLILDEEVQEAFAESDPRKLRAELVQVAAVAAAWVEKIDRDLAQGAR